MTTNGELVMQAELALASYGKLFPGAPDPTILSSENVGMSSSQAKRFADSWRVVDSFEDGTGVAATIFQRSNQLYLAIRGTQFEASDILADGLLALGVSASLNPQFVALKSQVDKWVSPGAPLFGKVFTVAGHSLGGYLAVAIKETYATSVSGAYVFNSPGSGGLVGTIADLVGSLFAQSSPGANGVWNVKASEGLSLVGGLGSQPSSQIPIQIEDGGIGIANHSIIRLTDALAVQALYSDLVPGATSTQLNALVDASGNPMVQTLESALDALRRLLLPGDVVSTPTDDREAFYSNLYGLTSSAQYQAIAGATANTLTVLTGTSAAAIFSLAVGNDGAAIATRYALRALNPFALGGVDYSALNSGGTLSLYDPQAQRNGLSQQYLTDRANFLERKSWFSTEDKNPTDPTVTYDPEKPTSFLNESSSNFFIDAKTGYSIRLGTLFPSTHIYGFGGESSDVLMGQSLEDHLYGAGGTDLLRGGQGDDHLEGGVGSDVYQFLAGDGSDTVLDADGKGILLRNGTALQVGIKVGVDEWQVGTSTRYTKVGTNLEIIFNDSASDKITIGDFDFAAAQASEYLGIRLMDAPTGLQSPVQFFIGDRANWDSDPSQDGVQVQIDAFGNIIRADGQAGRSDVVEANRSDVFYGSAADEVERFQTSGGDDAVLADGQDSPTAAAGGRDLIETGAGRDVVASGGADDWVEGGSEGDILAGNAGNDMLFADTSNGQMLSISQAIENGASGTESPGPGDLLSGDLGKDVLIGGAAADLLAGGDGIDIIVGAAGADNVYGDGEVTSASLGWAVTRSVNGAGNFRNYQLTGTGLTLTSDPSKGDSDVIYGGAGSDWIFAGAGDDYIEGGDTPVSVNVDDDVIFGESGSDVLLGGSGNDFLHGDSSTVDELGLWGDDYIDGGVGDDVALGGKGDDILVGGEGDDVLVGGPGKDTYIFNRGDGIDIVEDVPELRGGADASVLVLGEGVRRSDIKFRTGSLMVDIGGGDAVHFDGFSPDDPLSTPVVDAIQFADGSFMSYRDILDQGFDLDGTEGDDVITGTAVTDRIDGKGGNDMLLGRAGADTILGGTGEDDLLGEDGNDILDGGDGFDTLDGGAGEDIMTTGEGADIAFGGAGNDTINAGDGDLVVDVQGVNRLDLTAYSGLTAANLEVTQYQALSGETYLNFHVRDDANPGVTPTTGGVSVQMGELGYFATVTLGDGGGGTVTLSNEEVLTQKTAAGLFYQGLDGDETLVGTPFDDTMLGGAGSDTMTGNAGNDRIDGGYGDDMLAGGTGNDTYLLAYNGGRDTVIEDGVAEPNAVHTIQLEEGIDSSKVKAIRVGDDLEVRLRATADMLVLKDFYLQPQSWQDGWAVSDAQGISQPLGGFVVEIPPSRETWLAEQKAAFADRRSQVFGANRRAEGFQSLGGDTYRQVIHSFAYSLRQSHTTTWTKSLAVEALTSDEASIVADAGISRGPEAFSSTTYQLGSPIASGADTGRFAATPSFGNGNSPSSTGFGKAGVGAQSIETGTTVTPIYMPQRSNLLRDQQSSDYSGSGGYENELDWTYGGQTMYPQGSTPPAGVATNPVTAIDDNVFIQEQLLLTDVVAGDSDNFIGGASSIIEAGAGNDVIALASPFLLLGPDWETPLGVARDSRGGSSLGGFADAGAGHDFVDGSKGEDVIAGGDGADSLDGHLGSDTYLYSANETGIDTLQDTGLGAFSYLEWYYRSQGIENWEERSLHANQWRVLLGEGRDTEYFDSKSEADQFAADNEFLVPFVDFIAPLPAAAVVSRNDTATLNQLTNLGVLDRDVVKFGPGLAIDDLALTVTVNAPTLQERPGQPWYDGGKLSIRWGAAGIDLDVPAVQFGFEGTDVLAAAREGFPESGEWGNYALGAGIEAFQFADGSGYSLEQVLQRATVQTANFAYLFHRGSGTQIISSDFLAIKFKDGIRKSDVAITHDGVDLVLTLNDGSAQGRIVGYYADPANVPAISGSFADGVLNSDDLLYAGLTMQGTSADDGLQAVDGFPNTLRGGAGNDVLAGGNGDDGLFGEQGNDFVQGGAGADDIEDALGSNVLDGGAGNDYLYEEGHAFVIGATGDDQVVNYGPDSIVAYNAGDGNDTILVGSPLTLSLGGGLTTADMSLSVEGWDLLLTAGAGSIRLSGGLGADPATWPPITLQMFGSVHEYDFNAVIADFRDALAADPTLTSFALEGSLQAHETSSSNTEAIGGALAWQYATTGTLAGLSSAQKFSVLADPGFGTAPQPISLQAENHAPMLANPIADQTAADGAAFSFTVPADTFSDPDAGDSLTYTATLAGGGALPSWLVFDAATQAFSGSPASADLGTFDVTVSVTDGGGLASSDTFAITVGPAPDQFIVGTDADDVLAGGSGNDRIDGGLGADTMSGGLGNDAYMLDNPGDLVVENAGEGVDSVESSISYALPANVEKLTLTGIADIDAAGNALRNTLTGNGGSNTLDGGAGADTLIGGAGDDTYIVERASDAVVENLDEGLDAVRSSVSYTLSANVETLVLTGTSGIRGTGNGLGNLIAGNAAGNTLDGGAGADTLIGGAGNDTYIVDDAADAVVENAGEGTDTIRTSVSYALPQNVENLVLTGAAAITGTGNAQSNVLTGNAAPSTLIGGLGNDVYVVSDATTVIVENPGEGTDTVKASVSYALGDNLENLTLTGTEAIDAWGNALDNVLTGNAAANVLHGGAGDDVYVVDNAGDVVVENPGEGTDLVRSSVSYALSDNVEKLTLTGTAAIDGTGNALDNVLTGNAAANVLAGGLGDDTYVVDGADTVVEFAGEGVDTVKSSADWTLGDNLENLTLTGTASLNGFGNALANVIRGNAGANLLEGFEGNDTLAGNLANDVLQGGAGNDRLTDSGGNNLLDGGSGADVLVGGAGNELFAGGTSNDTVNTGAGTDIIAFNRGDGQDTVTASQVADNTVTLGGGIGYADLSFRKSGASLVLQVGVNAQTGVSEQLTLSGWYSTTADNRSVARLQVVAEAMAGFDPASADPLLNRKVQSFDFLGLVGAFDGARAANSQLTTWALSNALAANHLGGSDTEAVGGDLAYWYGRNGGFAGVSLQAARNVLDGAAFGAQPQPLAQVFQGGSGGDALHSGAANSVLAGGGGDDTLEGGAGNDFLAGDAGDDAIDTGAGSNVVAFNRGGGTDMVSAPAGASNALSLGGGIGYDDLSLSKSGNDLILNTGGDDHVVFKDWYGGKDSVSALQIILDATSAFDPTSTDGLYNRRVQTFDFLGIVSQFDQALAQTPGLTSWAVTNALLEFHLSGSDEAALGGDLAYWYGRNGSLDGISVQAAQQVIGAAGFGMDAQQLHPFSGLQDGFVKLG